MSPIDSPLLSRVVLALSLAPTAACLCQSSQAVQSAPSSVAPGRVISGELLNAKTGQPIQDATVTLSDTHQRKAVDSIQTDTEGRFSFTDLSDGKYALRASHRRYIQGAYQQHQSGTFTAIVTGEGLNSTDLKFMLEPQSAIYGTISEDSGDPVSRARISLYRVDPASSTGRMVRASSATSDGTGFYELPRLAPGTYYLAVSGTPWYATRSRMRDSQGNLIDKPGRSPLDVAYAVTYYPDSVDAGSASPITIAAGDRVQVSFTLHPVPAVHIRVAMEALNPGSNKGLSFPQLQQEIFGSSDFVQASGTTIVPRHPVDPSSEAIFELNGVAPGQYDVMFNAPLGQPARSMKIDASSDLLNLDPSAAVALADVSGNVVMASGSILPANLTLFLSSQQTSDRLTSRLAADGGFHLQAVHPGTYEVSAGTGGNSMAVTHLSATGATVDGRLLKIGSEPVTLNAQIAESIATVSGFAKLNGQPVSGVLLVLVPADPAPGQGDSRINQSDSDGSFEFQHVTAGAYIVVAIQDGWSLDWGRRETIARYLARGKKIDVPEEMKEIILKDPIEVQPK